MTVQNAIANGLALIDTATKDIDTTTKDIDTTTKVVIVQDAIANGLPLIDTTKTLVENYCPPFLMTPKCEVQRYRYRQ